MDPRFSARVTNTAGSLSVIRRESGESRNTNSKGEGRAPADLHPPLNKKWVGLKALNKGGREEIYTI